MKYTLIGLRSGSHGDAAQSYATSKRLIAILRGANGKRYTAEVSEDDCKSWPLCRAAIVRYMTRDGVKRIDESEIDAPPGDSGDTSLPWQRDNVPAQLDGQNNVVSGGNNAITARWTGTADRSAGRRYYQRQRGNDVAFSKSNQDYLREIGMDEATFDFTPSQRVAANEQRIKQLEQQIADKKAETLESMARIATQRQRNEFLEMTPLGRVILGEGRKN